MKKVAIVGSADTWKMAPFANDTFEIWSLNSMYDILPKCDVWFEMERMEYWKSGDVYNGFQAYKSFKTKSNHIEWLAQCGKPVYMTDDFSDEIPTCIKFPIDEIHQKYGRDYFNSTVDYMITLAMYLDYDEIHIYGVNMAVSTEHCVQRPSCEYWIGRAEGEGRKVFLPSQADLLFSYYRYGYEADRIGAMTLKCMEGIYKCKAVSEESNQQYYMAVGAKKVWEYLISNCEGEIVELAKAEIERLIMVMKENSKAYYGAIAQEDLWTQLKRDAVEGKV